MPSPPSLPDFDDEPTVVDLAPFEARSPRPPALPFRLVRAKGPSRGWLEELAPRAQRVLDRARQPAPRWPMAPRIPGAVAIPLEP